jgi:hypothetical protein
LAVLSALFPFRGIKRSYQARLSFLLACDAAYGGRTFCRFALLPSSSFSLLLAAFSMA